MTLSIEAQRKCLDMSGIPNETPREEVLIWVREGIESELGLTTCQTEDGSLNLTPSSTRDFLEMCGFNTQLLVASDERDVRLLLVPPGKSVKDLKDQFVLGGEIHRQHKNDPVKSLIYANGRKITPRNLRMWSSPKSAGWSVIASVRS